MSSSSYDIVKTLEGHTFWVYSVIELSDGEYKGYLASGSSDKTIKIWDAENFKVLQRIDKEENGHVNSVNSGFWDENSGMFISGSDDRSAIAWKIEKK